MPKNSKVTIRLLKKWDISEGIQKAITVACIKVQTQAKALAPVDTGFLRGSIDYEVKGERGFVGTNADYAPAVEFGTKRQAAQPFLRPAAKIAANPETIKEVAEKLNLAARKTAKNKKVVKK